jgi:hypothetical protein
VVLQTRQEESISWQGQGAGVEIWPRRQGRYQTHGSDTEGSETVTPSPKSKNGLEDEGRSMGGMQVYGLGRRNGSTKTAAGKVVLRNSKK